MKKIICVLLSLITVLIFVSCGKINNYSRFQRDYPLLFDTYITFLCYAENSKEFEKYSEIVRSTFEKYNQLFDIYNNYDGVNNIKTINDNAGKKPVNVDENIIELLNYGKKIYNDTDGAVNVAFGSVLKVWHNYREDGVKIPEIAELEQANRFVDINDIEIDNEKNTVFIKNENTSIDVGCCGKGYAVEKVAEELKKSGAKDFLINAGGNVCAYGKPLGKEGWTVGVENPDSFSSDYVRTINVTNKSVVTSGNYQRYYEVDGKKYHHIIDTKTLFPSEICKSATVIAENSAAADMLSTAIFILPIEKSRKLLKKYNASAIWIMNDGSIIES